MNKLQRLLCVVWCVMFAAAASLADEIQFKNGAKLSGKVWQVNKAAATVTIDITIAGRSLSRTYAFKDIRSLTQDGKAVDLGKPVAASDAATAGDRSKSAIEQLIRTEGASDPPWLAATKLNYPSTMDLNWPMPAPKPWNNRKNIGQFLWDVINPNQGRWREGVRFMMFLIERHKNNPTVRNRAIKALASIYFRLFQDYPRAAYWWRQVRLESHEPGNISLAECYFRMGNKEMALQALAGKSARTGTVKLLGAMGKTDNAIRLADAITRSASQPHETFLVAGDALALAGRYQEAIRYYNKTLTDRRKIRNQQYEKRHKNRARESIAAIQLFQLMDVSKLRDGTYRDSATGYNGPLQVEVQVGGGRITGLRIVSHKEKQYYSALRDTPAQIIAKQSVKDIDATSRATITAQAIVNAAAKALAKGR